MQDRATPPRPRNCDVSQPALFLERGQPAFVHRPLRGEYAFLPADQIDVVELQPLGGVDRHDRQFFGVAGGVIVHHQTDVFEKIAQRLVLFKRAGQLGQVLQPPGAFGAAFGLQRIGIAAFLEHDPRQLGWRQCRRCLAPTRKIAHKIKQRAARARRQFVAVDNFGRGERQRYIAGAGVAVDLLQRLVAQPAFGGVVDPLERQIVAGLSDQPQVSERIAHFGALVKAKAADDLVIEPDRNEPVLELAGLELRTDQDRNL